VHIHGTKDKVVPLSGRQIRQARQGDVPTVVDMYRQFGDFGAATALKDNDLSCQMRTNLAGKILNVCLF